MSETKATKRWSEILFQNGCMIIPFVAGMRQRAGLPDRFVAHRRLPSVWVEIKNETYEATELQKRTLMSLLAHEQTALVLRLDPRGRGMSAEAPDDDNEVLTMREPGRAESELDFLERSCVAVRKWFEDWKAKKEKVDNE